MSRLNTKKMIATSLIMFTVIGCGLGLAGFRVARHHLEDPDGVHAKSIVLTKPGHIPLVSLRYWSDFGSYGLILNPSEERATWIGIGQFRGP